MAVNTARHSFLYNKIHYSVQMSNFDESLSHYTLCPINSFKIPEHVYFFLGTHKIVTTVLLCLYRTDIPLYRGEN